MDQHDDRPDCFSSPLRYVPFSEEQADRTQNQLDKQLAPEHLKTRKGAGNIDLSYVEGWRIISIANNIFGFNGWSSHLYNCTIESVDVTSDGRFDVIATCMARITLRDGTTREDVGYGVIENAKSKGQAFEKVKKEAATDAIKRAMRQFGNALGNCLYDKEYLKAIKRVPKQGRGNIVGSNLYRYSDLIRHEPLPGMPSTQPSNAPANTVNTGFSSAASVIQQQRYDGGANSYGDSAQVQADTRAAALAEGGDSELDFGMDDAEFELLAAEMESNRPLVSEIPSLTNREFASQQRQPSRSTITTPSVNNSQTVVAKEGGMSAPVDRVASGTGTGTAASRNLFPSYPPTSKASGHKRLMKPSVSATPPPRHGAASVSASTVRRPSFADERSNFAPSK